MKRFSILIPTLEDRKVEYFDKLYPFLKDQCTSEVEICVLRDQKQLIVGAKRNKLIEMAQGDFVAFVDDDDWVSDTYVKDILGAIKSDDHLDCVGFWGEVYFLNELAGKMIHSIACRGWHEEAGFYYRHPNHLNPVRKSLITGQKFQHISSSEDYFWSQEMQGRGVLKREVFLGEKPTYIYKCRVAKKGL